MSIYKMNTLSLLSEYVRNVFPLVENELNVWRIRALACPDNMLSKQALLSIENKRFHAQGGSVFALYPGADTISMIKLIVAYQTISDYLDNLCDRTRVEDETAFLYLHISMTDALDCTENTHDYYRYYPYKDDGRYLKRLVHECKLQVSKIPSFHLVKEHIAKLVELYCHLQAYKHLSLDERERKLFQWTNLHIHNYSGIMPWEFCAAAGSTLGIFMLLSAAWNPFITSEEIENIMDAYFPWVCGLHILLDYFIDYNEDMLNKDLNFVQYYNDSNTVLNRMEIFIRESAARVSSLRYPLFHTTIVQGLLAMYLSDPKAYSKNLKRITPSLISSSGIKPKLMHWVCRALRSRGVI